MKNLTDNIETKTVNGLLFFILVYATTIRLFYMSNFYPYVVNWDEYVLIHSAIDTMKTGDFAIKSFFYGPVLYVIEVIMGIIWFLFAAAAGAVKSVGDISYNYSTAFVSHPSIYVAMRIPFVIAGVATIFMAYSFCARFLKNRWAGIFSALILAASMTHAQESARAIPNIPGAFGVMLAIYYCFVVIEKDKEAKPIHFFWLGLIPVAAITIRINNTPVFLAALGVLLLYKCNWRLRLFIYFFLGAAVGWTLFMPFYLDLPAFLNESGRIFSQYGSVEGITYFEKLMRIFRFFSTKTGIYALPAWLCLAGVVYFIVAFKKKGVLFLLYPVGFVLCMANKSFFGRYYLGVMICLSITGGALAGWLCTIPERLLKWKYAPAVKYLMIAGFVLLFSSHCYQTYKFFYVRYYKPTDERVLAVQWMQKNIPSGSKVFVAKELQFYPPHLENLPFEVDVAYLYKKKKHQMRKYDYVVSSTNYDYKYTYWTGDKAELAQRVGKMFEEYPIEFQKGWSTVIPRAPFFRPITVIYNLKSDR